MKHLFKTPISNGATLVFALMVANVLNFVFNAYLGRILTLDDFAVLAVVNTLWFLVMVFLNSLSTMVNHYVAYYSTGADRNFLKDFYRQITKNSLVVSIIITALWVLLVPYLSQLLNIGEQLPLLSITPIISIGTLLALRRGYLQGSFLFGLMAIIVLAESIGKLIFAYFFVESGLRSFAYVSIPLAVFLSFIVAYIFPASTNKEKDLQTPRVESANKSPLGFYVTIVINSIAGVAFLSLDILIVKHFMPADLAGAYALLSLIGKMIFFLGNILNGFVITYISRDLGENRDYKTTFYKIFSLSFGLTLLGYLFFGLFGHITAPILLGSNANAIISYTSLYGLGIAAFTLSTPVVAFHLSKKNYLPSYIGLVSTISMVIGLSLFHRSIMDIVGVITIVGITHFVIVMYIHLYLVYWTKQPVVERKIPSILDSLLNKLPVGVSICLPAYNEGKNIGKLLDKLLVQKTQNIHLNKIIVVSSASTDNTDEIVREYERKDPRVSLLTESKRNGKATAINLFLRHVDDPIVVIQSTDTIPDEFTIENLCTPFLHDEQIGMTGGAPIPVNDRNTFLGFVVHTWWWFHRHIPRFGEIIAFRNVLPKISTKTSVDEAYIQAKFVKMGYRLVHVDEAVVYNKGAERLKDMIKQRRRIHNGHLRLSDEESVKVGHLTKSALWLLLFKYEIKNLKEFIWLIGGMSIEVFAVLLALWDKKVSNKNPVVWDIAKSTKNLVTSNNRAQAAMPSFAISGSGRKNFIRRSRE